MVTDVTMTILESHGIPTNSYIRAIQKVTSWDEKSPVEFMSLIDELAEVEGFRCEPHLAKYVYQYLVQESIRAYMKGDQIPMSELLTYAVELTAKFEKRHSHAFTFVSSENPTPKPIKKESAPIEPAPIEPAPIEPAPVEPAPIERKVNKKTRALGLYRSNLELSQKEMVKLFMETLGLEKPSASTYVSNIKNGRWS